MKSQNFEFLRPRRPELADAGGFAEQYVFSDPISSLLKQRSFIEVAVPLVYDAFRLRLPFSDNLNDMLTDDSFARAVPEIVLSKLHTIRKAGNHAAHPRRTITSQLAQDTLQATFDIARWLHIQIDKGAREALPVFVAPVSGQLTNGKAREALERLRLAEQKYEQILADLEDERRRRAEAETLKTEAQRLAQKTEEELARLRAEGQRAVSFLQFSEEETRKRFIDQLLVEAGWDIGAQGRNTEQVHQEERLATMPTKSGEGYADYVVYGDDGKPLAVIEAKKTARDAREGQEQARIYADCLEREQGRRPVIFYTNGIDIFIWDDAKRYSPRKIYGFYSKDSLEYLVHQRAARVPLSGPKASPNPGIAGRMYQLEAIKRIAERFDNNFRKALIVQATGTGKTRVAISLCDVLMRASWAKRILFLCDRRELRRQADRTFKEFLPGEPRVIVDSSTSSDRDKRIYLATYPAMLKCYETFDVGFFDLVIADESHRSIYKKFRALFQYFDALQVGLTATPIKEIDRNTFALFGCEDRDPTAHYSYEDALAARYLVPFRVRSFQTGVREDGFRYADMSDEQKAQLEEQDDDPQAVDFRAEEVDRNVFNKDTSRHIWRTLMDEGIRDATGSQVGKTIVFARNHVHAVHLAELFAEMYPQYGGAFCRVIDNKESRAEQLIEDFKNPEDELTIAISVDMLDTGIDVPEVVNLVFAKPLKSYVKFWQMIGRGTRLRKNLFGPGRDKTEFMIFDHWRNFWFFDEKYQEKPQPVQKGLLQRLFEARIDLAKLALNQMAEPVFQATVDLIVADVNAVKAAKSIDVLDHRKELELLSQRERIAQFAAATEHDLRALAGPLMHWRTVRGEQDAYRFDYTVALLEVELARAGMNSPRAQSLKAAVEEAVELLAKNQSPVKAKAEAINQVRSKAFWETVKVADLEHLRLDLRGIMKYQQVPSNAPVAPRVYDVADDNFTAEDYAPKKLEGVQYFEYRARVEKVLKEHFENDAVLKKIRSRMPVTEAELEELARLVLRIDDNANIKHLVGYQPETRRSLLAVLRGLVGLDPTAVESAFTEFVHKHPDLSAQQIRFLQLLQNHITQQGGIEVERLYEPPFTNVHAESVDGLFPKAQDVDELLAILQTFEIKAAQ